jgi:hypothetical protein
MEIDSEKLAYWYFRLNGFFGNENYSIHDKLRSPLFATEIDYIGIRFMNRKELLDFSSDEWMQDDYESELFNQCIETDVIYIALAEAKKSVPNINKSQRNYVNIEKILSALGCFRKEDICHIAKEISEIGFSRRGCLYITFVTIGTKSKNARNTVKYQDIPIITWDEVKRFLHKRFTEYREEKKRFGEWDKSPEIIKIRELAKRYVSTFDKFNNAIKIIDKNEKRNKKNKLDRAYEAHRYWQNMSLCQLSTANNWLLGAATGFLSFCIYREDLTGLRFDLCHANLSLTFYVLSLWLSLFSILAGVIVLISRLWDFRITRKVANVRKKFYDYADKFPECDNKEPNCCEQFLSFLSALCFLSLPSFNKNEIKALAYKDNDLYGKAITKLSSLRQKAHNLGIITWEQINWQIIWFLLSVVCFIIYHLNK